MENNTQEKQSPIAEKKPVVWIWVILIILCASFFGAVFGFMAGSVGQAIVAKNSFLSKLFQGPSGSNANVAPQIEKIVEEDSIVTQMVEKTSPAVVSIVISKDVSKYRTFDPFNFFSQPAPNSGGTQKQTVGAGSGFLVSNSGMIVTNKHVVDDMSADYTAVTTDGKEYPAKVLARDPVQDIAVLKIQGNNFPVLPLGDSDQMKIGQTVVAIGNSLGEFSNTVSKGIISGLKRNLTAGSVFGGSEQLSNILQTDAAINPGNSGGPLLNINGEVIGVNVAIAEGAQNVGFAIPVNQIKKVITQVQSTGKISTPFLGVRYLPITKDIQTQNNLAFDYGAIVIRGNNPTELAVMPGSPADKAGIVENDIILEINGTKVDQNNSVSDLIAGFNVGDVITLKIWHKGETKDVKVTLAERK